MSGPVRVRHGRLHFFVRETLKRRRLPGELASRVADALVGANLAGEDGDGVAWLPDLATGLATRQVNPGPAMKIVSASGGVAVLDGDNGPGPAVAHRAMTEAISGANRHGVGGTAVRRSNRPGMASHFAAMALRHQMAGVALTGARTPSEGAHGRVALGIAVPMAETVGPLVLNLELGETEGERDLALLLALESLVLLGGGALAPELAVGDRPDPTHRGTGHLFLAFRVRAFAPWAGFRNRMVERLDHLRRARVRYPGQDAAEVEEERRARGIPLAEETARSLARLAYGLGMNAVWDELAQPVRRRPARERPAGERPVREEPARERTAEARTATSGPGESATRRTGPAESEPTVSEPAGKIGRAHV